MIDAALAETVHLVADRHRAVLDVADVARFGIEGGSVTVEPEDGVDAGPVDAWREGLVAALALAQRGRFALHANLVEVEGVAIALAGARGAGKSTASLLMTQRGARLLGDDVLPLERRHEVVAYETTARPLHVTPETAEALGVDVSRAARLAIGREKLVLPGLPAATGELGAIVALEVGGVRFEHRRLTGIEALRAVHANTYRLLILSRVWKAELFAWAGAVAAGVPVHRVARPAEGWTGDEVAAAVETVAAEVRGG